MVEIVNPYDPTQVWSGRGRKPKWLKENEEAGQNLGLPPNEHGLRFWKLITENRHVDCIVGAKDPVNAVHTLNKTFRFPVSSSEFITMWREISHETLGEFDQSSPSVWQYNPSECSWETRPTL